MSTRDPAAASRGKSLSNSCMPRVSAAKRGYRDSENSRLYKGLTHVSASTYHQLSAVLDYVLSHGV